MAAQIFDGARPSRTRIVDLLDLVGLPHKIRFVPVQTRLTEPTGDHTTVRFDKVVINGPLKAGSFDLALPQDVVEVQ